MMSLLIIALWRSREGNSYELPSIMTAVMAVKCLDTMTAHYFIMKMYLDYTS